MPCLSELDGGCAELPTSADLSWVMIVPQSYKAKGCRSIAISVAGDERA